MNTELPTSAYLRDWFHIPYQIPVLIFLADFWCVYFSWAVLPAWEKNPKYPKSGESAKRLSSSWTEWGKHNRPGERKRSPAANSTDDPSTRKRDEGKARTRTEGDSKVPSASISSSTCCKAGAWGKHTRNVVTTLGSVREESRTGTSQPSRRMDEPARLRLHCPLPLVRRQGNPKAERGATQWEGPFRPPFHCPRSD